MLLQLALLLSISPTPLVALESNESGRLVTVGSHKIFLDCRGDASGPTVVLEAGTGDTSEVWSVVQKQVDKFARVCSYDRLGLGKSDKLASSHTADEIVSDLHQLLRAASISPPYVMVGHSIGGIYVRKYTELYSTEVVAIVLLDSAHEEQFTRVAALSPEWAHRIASKFPPDEQRAEGFLSPNERLDWQFDKPMIVIEHEEMPSSTASDPMAKQSEVIFHVLQQDLATRSKYGQLREAKKSGHYIQRDEPELVTQAIQDVIRQAPNVGLAKPNH